MNSTLASLEAVCPARRLGLLVLTLLPGLWVTVKLSTPRDGTHDFKQ